MSLKQAVLFFVVLLCLLHQPTFAHQFILDAWRVKYPTSTADDVGPAGCQLCHQLADGGEPWNAYGWDVRTEYIDPNNNFDLNVIFDRVENANQDNDPRGANAEDEILANFQPGWTVGAVNTVFMKNGFTITNLPPPMFPVLPVTTALDFPAPVNDPIPSAIASNSVTLDLTEVATGFNAPLRAVKAPGINGSLFVVEQTGKIFRVDLASGAKSLFLNVASDLVIGGERGLLGLAFHPDYASNGLFYTYQSEPRRDAQNDAVDFSTIAPSNPNHRSMIVEYQASNPACNSFISKRDTLMIIDQPQSNHNGGDLVFDSVGNLYISVGDGGNAHDLGPGHGLFGNGRTNLNVLGSILRINPLGNNSANSKYGIPASNPFVGVAGVDEIFAYGLRNPFRMSIDSTTGNLYAGDVGQGDLEEVNHIVSGGNYGWNWKEGTFSFYNLAGTGSYVSSVEPPNLPNNLVDPIGQYDRSEGRSVIGGYVYRGSTIPNTTAKYVFGEYSGPSIVTATGRLFSLDLQSNLQPKVIEEFIFNNPIEGYITGFGQDANNELYVVTNNQLGTSGVGGKLLKLVELGDVVLSPAAPEESALCPGSNEGNDEMCVPIKAANGSITVICL